VVLAYVDGSVVDECVDACFDNVLVHVFEGAVSFQFADSPVVHAFAGIADETADGLADAVSEAEQAFARVDESDYRRVDYLGVLDVSLPVPLFVEWLAWMVGSQSCTYVQFPQLSQYSSWSVSPK
jgi:hypothetical protein